MRTLVIDTATCACSVALFDHDVLTASQHEVIGRGHAERLLPHIAALPGRGRADRVAVNIGPGSFTGIRVGISAAKALALAWDAECFGYHCLALIAAMARMQAGKSVAVDVIMTGGHGEYFFQSYAKDGSIFDSAASLEIEAAARLSAAQVIAGDAADLLGERRTDVTVMNILPDARHWPLITSQELLPASAFYGRPPDAKQMTPK